MSIDDVMKPDQPAPPARATGPLIPQPHGGALRPWEPSRPSPHRKPIKQITREMVEQISDSLPESVAILGEIVRNDPDSRNRLVAIKIQFDAIRSAIDDGPGGLLDLSHLSPGEMVELQIALATIHRLTGSNPE